MVRGDSPEGGGRSYRWLRGNVLGLVAIFIALSGCAVAVQVASDPTTQDAIKSKKKKARLGPAGPQGPQGPPGPSTGPAGGSLTGSYPNPGIAGNAIGAGEIQNPIRSLNLPIATFVNASDGAALDFTPSNGTSPDFILNGSGGFEIQWDDDTDGGGVDTADNDLVTTTLMVPPDYASGGTFVVRIRKVGNAGVTERFGCDARHDGSTFGVGFTFATIASAAATTYLLVPNGSAGTLITPGEQLEMRCLATDGFGGTTADDLVSLIGAEFRYTATE